MSKISIALCTYNGAKFLLEQLESFLQQTRLPDELIVGDDCSTDETIEIVQDFARLAPFPVKLERNRKNLGSTRNFESTILRCTGDLIFLSDQDDVWQREKIEKSAAILENSPRVGFVFTDAELVNEKLQKLAVNLWQAAFTPAEQTLARNGKMLQVLIRRNVVTGATMAFRAEFRSLFTPIPTYLPNVIHDAWIALVISAVAEVAFISEPLMQYRLHAGQQLGINWRGQPPRDKFSTRAQEYAFSIAFYQKELERFSLLLETLAANPAFAGRLSEINSFIKQNQGELKEIIRHYELRKNLPKNNFNRFAPIVGEVLSGRYHRFSKGLSSAAKDFLEKI